MESLSAFGQPEEVPIMKAAVLVQPNFRVVIFSAISS
jgi:hypothetical protein